MPTSQGTATDHNVDNITESFRLLGVMDTNHELQQEISDRVYMVVVDTCEAESVRGRANSKALPAYKSLCIEELTRAFLAFFGEVYWNSGSKAQPGRTGNTPILESNDRAMLVSTCRILLRLKMFNI